MSNDPLGLFGTFIPNVYVKKIDIFDSYVDLSLSIKESSLPSGLFSVSSFDFIKKYVKLSIQQEHEYRGIQQIIKNNISISLNNIDQYDLVIDPFNSDTRDIVFNHRFYFDTTNLYNLKYVVYTSLDQEQIASKFGLSSFNIQGKSTNEEAIKKGEIPNLYIYRIGNNTGPIWYGDVVQKNTNQYTTKETPPRNLIRQEIPNTKIKDFRLNHTTRLMALQSENILNQRNANSIEFLRGRETTINNLFTNNLLKNLEEKSEIIANRFQLKDSKKIVSFLFSINYKSLIIKNTQYREILNNLTIPKILNLTNLININLYRKQVADNQTFNSKIKEVFTKKMVSNTFKEVDIKNIKSENVKNYLISDNSSTSINGKYEYYLHLEFDNGTIRYLRNHLEYLINNKNNVLLYSKLLDNKNFFDTNLEKFSNNPLVQAEIRTYYDRYKIPSIIAKYIEIITELNNHDSDTKDKNTQLITNYISPSSGNLKGINLFIKLYDKLIAMLQRYCSIKTIAGDAKETGKASGGETTRIIIEKKFNDIVDLSYQDLIELEYVRTDNHIISSENLEKSIVQQIQYYKIDGTQFNPEANYTFISPSNIYFNNSKQVSRGGTQNLTELEEEKYFSSLLTHIKLSNKKKNKSVLNVDDPLNRMRDKQNINLFFDTLKNLEEDGVTVMRNSNEPLTPFITDSQQYYLQQNVVSFLYTQKNVYDSIEELIEIENTKQPIVLQPSVYSTRYPPFREGKVPNQIARAAIDNIDLNKNHNILKYRLLGQIQYALELKDGKIIWKDLTRNDFANLRNLVFARIIFHDYFYNSNVKYKDINFKLFTDYFFIDFNT